MLCENVKSYLANSKGLPFFYVVGDEDYKEILRKSYLQEHRKGLYLELVLAGKLRASASD